MPPAARADRAAAPRGAGAGSGWTIGVILAVAALLRIAYLIDYRAHSVFWDVMLLDAEVYDRWARDLAAGGWIGGTEVFYLPPLYPYFLAVLYAMAGPSYPVVYVVQSLLGLANIWLIWLIGRRAFDPPVPALAAAIATLYGSFMFLDAKLLSTTIALTLSLILLRLMIAAGERQTLTLWGGCGALLGIAALARPETLLFAPFALWWIHRVTRRPDRLIRRERTDQYDLAGRQPWFAIAVFTAFAIIAVSPVTLRNWVVSGDWSLSNLISSQAGITFYQSNNPRANGLYVFLDREGFSGDPFRQVAEEKAIAEKDAGRPLKRSEVSRYWLARGLRWIASNPGRYLFVQIRKLQRYLGSYEYSTEYLITVEREAVRTLRVAFIPFGLISALGLVGIAIRLRQRLDSAAILLMLFLVANFVVVMLFYVSSRYRMPSAPCLILFAAFACARLWRGIRERVASRRTEAILYAAVALVLFLLFHSQVDESARIQEANVHYNAGNKYYETSRYEQAVAEYRRAVEMDPANWRAWFNLGNTLGERLGRTEEAIAAYRKVLERVPGFDPAKQQIRRMGAEP